MHDCSISGSFHFAGYLRNVLFAPNAGEATGLSKKISKDAAAMQVQFFSRVVDVKGWFW